MSLTFIEMPGAMPSDDSLQADGRQALQQLIVDVRTDKADFQIILVYDVSRGGGGPVYGKKNQTDPGGVFKFWWGWGKLNPRRQIRSHKISMLTLVFGFVRGRPKENTLDINPQSGTS